MPSHRLILEGDSSKAEWRLFWDDAKFVLEDPDGQTVFEAEAPLAHRTVDLYELYSEGKISFAGVHRSLVFKKNATALAAVRQFVEAGIAGDEEFRTGLRRTALFMIPVGLALFVVGGTLFGLCCWYAATAPDPPPDHWLRRFGWVIRGAFLALLAVSLGGMGITYFGIRQWVRIRGIEQAVRGGGKTREVPDRKDDSQR